MGIQTTTLMDDYGSGGGDFDGPPDANYQPSGPQNYNATTVVNTTPIGFSQLRTANANYSNPDKVLTLDGTQIYVTPDNVESVTNKAINSIALATGKMPDISNRQIIVNTIATLAKLPDVQPKDGLYENGSTLLQPMVVNAAVQIRSNQLGRKLTTDEWQAVYNQVRLTLGYVRKPDGPETTKYLASLKSTLDAHGTFTENTQALANNTVRGAKAVVLGTSDFIGETVTTVTNSVGGLFKLADVAGYVLLAWGVYQFMKKGK